MSRPLYRWNTLELKELVRQLLDRKIAVGSLLSQAPCCSNYSYTPSAGTVDYIYSGYRPSKVTIAKHISLRGLTPQCRLILTKEQHAQMKRFQTLLV